MIFPFHSAHSHRRLMVLGLSLTTTLAACSFNATSPPATFALIPPTYTLTPSSAQTLAPTPTQTPLPPSPTPTQTLVVKSPTPSLTPTPVPAYVFPIQPPEIANYQRGHHDYPATDIFVPIGSSVVAVTNG